MCRQPMSNSRVASRIPWFVLLLWLQQHLHKDSANEQHSSKRCSRCITCPHLILVSMPNTGKSRQEERTNEKMRQHFYWPHMITYVYKFVRLCGSCTLNKSQVIHKRELQLFPTAESLIRGHGYIWTRLRTPLGNNTSFKQQDSSQNWHKRFP